MEVIPSSEDRQLAAQVMEVDEAYRRAKLANATEAIVKVLHDDYYGVNQNGNARDKKAALELWKEIKIQSLTTDRATVPFSGDTAMVMGEQTERSATGIDRMLFTRAYVIGRSGGWLLLSSTQFRNPQGPLTADSGR